MSRLQHVAMAKCQQQMSNRREASNSGGSDAGFFGGLTTKRTAEHEYPTTNQSNH
jgi:hypothetical protein